MQFLADYLLSRAQAALESTDALEKGHAQYVASMAGTWGWGPVALLPACSCFHASSSPRRLRGHRQAAMPWWQRDTDGAGGFPCARSSWRGHSQHL